MKLNYATLSALVIVLAVLGIRFATFPWTTMRIAGLLIILPSLILLVMARVQLAAAFSVEAKADVLVTRGLYSRLRNPIYIFGGFVLIGMALLADRPWFLLALLIVIPLQVIRSRREEQVLSGKFGTEYEEYKSRTWL